MSKLFTKSAFKVALSCPWKLYYYRNPDVYNNDNQGDEFLESLAKGGFQVGELAKYYCQVDVDADLKNLEGYDESLERTSELMKRENVTIAEAAFKFGNMFVRVDILKKQGNHIELIEVKAKSWDPGKDNFISTKPAGSVMSKIREYVYDAAFQKYVVTNALSPEYEVKAYLMMADKSKTADINGLNQLFKIRKHENGQSEAIAVDGFEKVLAASSTKVLSLFQEVDDICDRIISGTTTEQEQNAPKAKYEKEMSKYLDKVSAAETKGKTCRAKHPVLETSDNDWMQGLFFKDFVERACRSYCGNYPFVGSPALCGSCFNCEFTGTGTHGTKKDGKAECWARVPNFGDKPMVENLNGSNISRGDFIKQGMHFMDDLDAGVLKENTGKDHVGLDYLERKWLQIGLETGDNEVLARFADKIKGNTYLDVEGLRREMDTWHYPLHMIDFETTAVALPYYEGMRPYEQVAFQFSHHVIHEDGTIEHKSQYLNEDVSKFPNFEFVRKLKEQLDKDNGTIFRYATHENTILREIACQLGESSEPDKTVLIEFIRTITHNDDNKKGECYKGDRDMVDLLEIVKKYFYNVDEMHGSNSIKQVLPAVLNCSKMLKDKYSKPIYGKAIKSCNFTSDKPKAWIVMDEKGHVESPYHLLESVGKLIGEDERGMEKMESLSSSDSEFEVANGGAALTAYNKLMFCEDTTMNDALRSALFRYCELDTMSMVFIWEYFHDEVYSQD